jgi:adenylate cyclase
MADDSLTTDDSAHPVVPGTTGQPLRAVMFADIAGTNALYQALGDIQALALITRALVATEQQVFEHRGQVIKTVGQEMLCLFHECNAAATAAIAMQQRMEHFAVEAGRALTMRIGLLSGPLIEDHGDVFGDAVNMAARLVKLANPGQIITDGQTVSGMRSALRRRARQIDRLRVKGKRSETEIVEIGWRRDSGDPFTTEQGMLLDRSRTARMVLRFGGEEIVVDGARASFTIGRDESNDLPISGSKASRQHARIEWRRDKFVLFDHSTNGTYVTLDGEPEMMIKHESMLLHGSGVLSIGQAASPQDQGLIEFECR